MAYQARIEVAVHKLEDGDAEIVSRIVPVDGDRPPIESRRLLSEVTAGCGTGTPRRPSRVRLQAR